MTKSLRHSFERALVRSLTIAGVVALAGCNLDVAQAPDSPTDPATETFAPGLMVDISKMQKTTAGTYYQDLKVGTGATLTPAIGVSVIVSYAGFLKDGAVFAQALDQLLSITSLPPGLADGMTGMNEGGERLVVVPSALGYRNVPVPGVPANSTLVFDVILTQLP
ncbi:MAG: FKBP-type peptidyl-prolyl cis-trans isomerase [Gemmatimonadaceae bacterium]